MAGCPVDKFAGVYLKKHIGEKVKKGEKVLLIYCESKHRLNETVAFVHSHNPFVIR